MKHIDRVSVKKIFSTIQPSFADFFLIHLLYTALGFTLFTPLTGAVGQLIINVSSRPVLADTDILFFLLSPYGILAAVLFAALLATIVIFEISSMMFLYGAASLNLRGGLFSALSFAAARSVTLFTFSLHLIFRLLAITLPFLAVAACIALLNLTDYDINYYLSVKPPVFWVAGSAVMLVLLCMVAILIRTLLAWSLSLPLVLFEDAAPRRSFAASSLLVAGRKKQTATLLISWGLTVGLISLVVLGLVDVLSSHLFPLFYHSLNLLIVAVGGVALLLSVVNVCLTSLFAASFSGILVELLSSCSAPVDTNRFPAADAPRGVKVSRSALIGLALISIVAATATGYWLMDGVQAEDDLVIVAHRGAAGKAPENTMAAIKQAIADGTDWVEIDVQESRDGHVVVVHDSDFMKLADTNLKIWEATLDQISDIDVGSWFSPEFGDQRVPLLRDVLEASKGKARVVIELKYYGHDEQLEQRVIDIVEQADMVDDIAIMSLKYDAILKVRRLRPEWTIGLLSATVLGNMSGLDADFLAVNRPLATTSFIRTNQEAGKKVFVWTVNDRKTMFSMMSRGVDGIITDEPALARQMIADRAELSSVERLLVQAAIELGKDLPGKTYRDNSP